MPAVEIRPRPASGPPPPHEVTSRPAATATGPTHVVDRLAANRLPACPCIGRGRYGSSPPGARLIARRVQFVSPNGDDPASWPARGLGTSFERSDMSAGLGTYLADRLADDLARGIRERRRSSLEPHNWRFFLAPQRIPPNRSRCVADHRRKAAARITQRPFGRPAVQLPTRSGEQAFGSPDPSCSTLNTLSDCLTTIRGRS